MLGKFNSLTLAKSYSETTVKLSAVILGDDQKYWVVNLREFSRLIKAGYSEAI
jgi:hypothetical protein